MEHGEYLKRRDELNAIRSDSFDSFDRAILAISTGSLALSITFLEKIGRPFSSRTFLLISLTWLGLAVVIIANLLSFFFAQRNMDRKIRDLDDRYRAELQANKKGLILKDEPEKRFWQRTATTICNFVVLCFFAISFLSFSWYVVEIQRNNYHKYQEGTVSKEKAETSKKPIKLFTEGKTEIGMAMQKGGIENTKGGADILKKGKTEPPQAVLRPKDQPTSKEKDNKK